jgi:hypothetical protein
MSVCLRSQPLFTLDSDETSHEDDGKWNSDGKVSERSNTTPDIRLADNDAQIWRDRALRESQAAMTNTPQQTSEDQVIKNKEDNDEKFNLECPSTGGNVNYLRYSMCKSM